MRKFRINQLTPKKMVSRVQRELGLGKIARKIPRVGKILR